MIGGGNCANGIPCWSALDGGGSPAGRAKRVIGTVAAWHAEALDRGIHNAGIGWGPPELFPNSEIWVWISLR
jgi:hypothetical protein